MSNAPDAERRDDTACSREGRLDPTDRWCLEQPDEPGSVTAYDEQWFLGRPQRP